MRNNNSLTIGVSPDWIVRERDIVHELAHAFSANQDIFFEKSILPLIDEEIKEVISNLHEKQVEQDTEAIAYMMEEFCERTRLLG